MDKWFWIIYGLIAGGAVGLVLIMPGPRRSGQARSVAWLGMAVLLALLVTLLIRSRTGAGTGGSTDGGGVSAGTDGGAEHVWFCVFAFVAIACAVLMICQKKALYSALYFVITNLAVAALLLLQQAEFLAVALVIVYAGAIMVIYVFVLMFCSQDRPAEYDTQAHRPFWAVLIGFVLIGSLLQLLLEPLPWAGAVGPALTRAALADTGTALQLGRELFNNQVVALEIAGVILLIAAIGGMAIIKGPRIKD